MKTEKIAVTISPYIEEMFLQDRFNDIYSFFQGLISFSKELRSSVIICLPFIFQYGLKNSKNPMMKVLHSQICLPNSNIIFWRDANQCGLNLIDKKINDILVDLSTIGLLTDFFKNYKIPMILDIDNRVYIKDECNKISCSNLPCKSTFTIDVSNISNKSILLNKLKENCKTNLNDWIIYKDDIQINDFRNMFYFAAYTMNVEMELYEKISEIEFLDDYILNDIKHENSYVLRDIATSILRAYLFGPASDRNNRTEFCIDYHPNSPSKKSGYDLLRLDVIDMKYCGYKDNHSGSRRILIARKDKKKYIIAYVPNHDFSEELINSRVSILEEKLNS
ncbi:MAG: hypothetical protein IIW99_03105 [Treponema sp.]|nr:hypothetical protein [Treponema sp.]